LISAAIAVGISGVIALAAIAGMSVYTSGKVNNEVAALNEIKNNVVKLGATTWGPFTTTNASLAQLIAMNVFPASMVSGASVVHSFGGGVSTGIAALNAAGDGIVVNYGGITRDACIDLVKKSEGFSAFTQVNTVTVRAAGQAVNVATLTGNTACGAGDNNTISFSIMR